MEDRFLYRIYAKKHKSLVTDILKIIFDYETKSVRYVTREFLKWEEIPFDECIILQCTGLHDSTKWEQLTESEKKAFYNSVRSEDGKTIKYQNIEKVKPLWKGKLIYFGDILKYEYEELLVALHSKRVVKIGVVRLPDDCFVAQCFDEKQHCTAICQEDWEKSRVIGNIYSTPELLEGKE